MEVKNRIMYHVHKMGGFDELWEVGNEIVVDENFKSRFSSGYDSFDTCVLCEDDSIVTFDKIINQYLKEEEFEKIDKELIRRIFITSRAMIKNMNTTNRENALEFYRRDHYPNLPCRLKCIWLTNKKGLKYWENVFANREDNNKDYKIFKVEVTGVLFKSSDSFIPDANMSFIERYKASEKYWNPVFKTDKDEREAEYLFQGKLKIIEEIK